MALLFPILIAILASLLLYGLFIEPLSDPLRHLPSPEQPPFFKRFLREPDLHKLEQRMREIPDDGLIRYYGFWGFTKTRQRKALRPAFKLEHIRGLYPLFWSKAVVFLDSLNKEFTSDDTTVNVSPLLGRQTLDMIGAAAFGLEFQAVRHPERDFTANYFKGFSTSRLSQLNILLSLILPNWLLNLIPLKKV
ncbi:uncharacterized protein Z518_05766 [Rhinocladiella mackenziei CBS 650.93]|uniref:Uncharacterized protein n=1 Tax=Rhinocladiella mackenziei CBS 650.93 TaxID=1442369 RepID=A0A0D2J733_9EURO|nr:uncharacterized protein Z518_05766 [Rhinocladiella mackenziei CBS 650.93]KIX04895.1 hypothetical protein Z518_05766 [Rhinocladiella mackenziei CBS 650.93]